MNKKDQIGNYLQNQIAQSDFKTKAYTFNERGLAIESCKCTTFISSFNLMLTYDNIWL